MRSLGFVFIAFLASTLPACGGCGDDTAADPDAQVDPDAEVPDAEVNDPPPGPVTNLTAAAGASAGIDLAWTNPTDADLAGVLVVVSGAAITFDPTDGTSYTAAQDLGTGQTVLSVSAGTAATLAAATATTRYFFSAWAFDDATQYSTATTVDGSTNALGVQTATISITLAGVVTVTSAPANFTLTGTAVYTDAADTLDVDLTVQNDTPRLIFNLKALNTAQNEGAQAGNIFPVTGGQPSTYYGPEALDVAGTATRTMNLTGITGATDPITVNLSFVDAPMLFSGRRSTLNTGDTSGSNETSGLDPYTAGAKHAVLSPDAHYLYVGNKDSSAITTVDTTTMQGVAGADLGDAANGLGSIGGVALSPDGSHLYALLTDGAHYHQGDASGNGDPVTETEVQLVELNTSDLSEVQRITIATGDTNLAAGRDLALNDAGTRAALVLSNSLGAATANQLWLVDLGTFTVIDADGVTAGDQPVVLSTLGWAYHAAWSGNTVYVGFNNKSWNRTTGVAVGLDVVDATTFAVAQIAAPTGGGTVGQRLVVHGGKLYYPSYGGTQTAGMHIIEGTTVTPLTEVTQGRGIAFDPSGARYYVVTNDSTVFVYDATTNAAIDTDGDDTNGVTPFNLDNDGSAFTIVTPF